MTINEKMHTIKYLKKKNYAYHNRKKNNLFLRLIIEKREQKN